MQDWDKFVLYICLWFKYGLIVLLEYLESNFLSVIIVSLYEFYLVGLM